MSEEMAWAAGLFEGEGSIGFDKRQKGTNPVRSYLRFSLVSTDRDVVERFVAIVGIGKVLGPHRPHKSATHHKDQWRWAVTGSTAMKLANNDEFVRHLGKRRSERLIEVLAVIAAQPPPRRKYWNTTHCPQGHPYSGENLRIYRGWRYCRICMHASDLKRSQQHGAAACL